MRMGKGTRVKQKPKEQEYKKLDRLTTEVIFGILKIKIKIDKYIKEENGKEVIDMCQAFEDYKEEGKREGKRIGKSEGKFEGEL